MADSPAGTSSSRMNHSLLWTRYNPPGQPALFYRPDAYQRIVARMLDELRNQKVVVQNQEEDQPLIHFNTLAVDDWTVAFLRAWATVSAVLSFYQERIINEGYLRTATERRSVLELTRAVGYELSPPVAATTYLAFTVQEAIPGKNILVPRGTGVQSIPAPFSSAEAIQDIIQGQASPAVNLPVMFETSDDLIAHPDWNALAPARIQGLAWPGKNKTGRTLRLAGSSLGLKPGDLLLIAGRAESTDGLAAWELLQLSQVDSFPKEGYTAVRWGWAYGPVPEEDILHPHVYVFRRKTALFPYVAGGVFRRMDLGWAPTDIGLPPKPVQAAAASGEGRLYAGIEQAVYSSSDRGDSWQPAARALPPKDVYALAAGPGGTVAAGGADGGVHVSNDGGESWSPLSGPGEVEMPTGWRRFIGSVRYKLPKTNIRSLLFAEKEGIGLLAGSDDGVFGYNARHDSWVSMNEHLPALDRKKGTAPLAVHALAAVDGGRRILAGTDVGVFPVEALFNGPSSAVLTALLVLLLPGTLNTILPDFLKEYLGQIYMLLPIGVLIVLLLWQQPFRQKWVGFALAIELYVILGVYFFSGLVINLAVMYLTVLLLAMIFLALNLLKASLSKLPGLMQSVPERVKRFLPGVFQKAKQPRVFSLLAVESQVYAGTERGVYRLEKQNWAVRFVRWWRRLFLGPEPEPWKEIPGWGGEDPADQAVTALALDQRGYLLAGTLAGNLYEWKPGTAQSWIKVDMPLASIRAIVITKEDAFALGAPLDAPQEIRWAPAQLQAGAVDLEALSLNIPARSFAAAIDGGRGAVFRVTGAMEQTSHDAKQAGQLTRLTVVEKKELSAFDRATTRFYCQSEQLEFFDDQFLPHPVQGKEIVLAGPVTGLEEAEDKVMLIAGKTPQGEPCSELITITKAVSHQTTTTVQLKDELASLYDRDSVRIYGNIVQAIQGQTIRNESLGESDGTLPNQRFLLRSPLAYEPTGSDYKTSLAVRVNQIQWTQVPSLLDQPAGARVYMVRRNDQGQTAVIFGDGEQGARLPTSREILTAAYRSGGGETGNLPGGGLTLLQSHLPYVKEVTNPAPAQGGLPAESAGHGREQAPKRVRALGRIVTLKDHSDFTSTFPGVSQSAVRGLPEQAPRWIEIAILPKHDPQTDPAQTAPLLTELEKAIHRSRSSAILPVKLHLYRPIFFSLAMQLHLSAEMRGDENRQNYLKQAVRRKILERYSLEMQTLGGAVIETEIFQRVQSVHGILAVTLTGLQKTDPAAEGMEVPLPVSQLTANWDELLLLTANDLTVEVLE